MILVAQVPREVDHLKDFKARFPSHDMKRWIREVIATACGDVRALEHLLRGLPVKVHTLALTDDGYVYSFGGGSYGQLGVKDVPAMPVDADNCSPGRFR